MTSASILWFNKSVPTGFSDPLHSPAFAELARSPDHLHAFTRARKRPLPALLGALPSFRGGRVQRPALRRSMILFPAVEVR